MITQQCDHSTSLSLSPNHTISSNKAINILRYAIIKKNPEAIRKNLIPFLTLQSYSERIIPDIIRLVIICKDHNFSDLPSPPSDLSESSKFEYLGHEIETYYHMTEKYSKIAENTIQVESDILKRYMNNIWTAEDSESLTMVVLGMREQNATNLIWTLVNSYYSCQNVRDKFKEYSTDVVCKYSLLHRKFQSSMLPLLYPGNSKYSFLNNNQIPPLEPASPKTTIEYFFRGKVHMATKPITILIYLFTVIYIIIEFFISIKHISACSSNCEFYSKNLQLLIFQIQMGIKILNISEENLQSPTIAEITNFLHLSASDPYAINTSTHLEQFSPIYWNNSFLYPSINNLKKISKYTISSILQFPSSYNYFSNHSLTDYIKLLIGISTNVSSTIHLNLNNYSNGFDIKKFHTNINITQIILSIILFFFLVFFTINLHRYVLRVRTEIILGLKRMNKKEYTLSYFSWIIVLITFVLMILFPYLLHISLEHYEEKINTFNRGLSYEIISLSDIARSATFAFALENLRIVPESKYSKNSEIIQLMKEASNNLTYFTQICKFSGLLHIHNYSILYKWNSLSSFSSTSSLLLAYSGLINVAPNTTSDYSYIKLRYIYISVIMPIIQEILPQTAVITSFSLTDLQKENCLLSALTIICQIATAIFSLHIVSKQKLWLKGSHLLLRHSQRDPKQSETALKIKQTFENDSIINSIPFPIIITKDNKIIQSNISASNLVHKSETQLYGQPLNDTLHLFNDNDLRTISSPSENRTQIIAFTDFKEINKAIRQKDELTEKFKTEISFSLPIKENLIYISIRLNPNKIQDINSVLNLNKTEQYFSEIKKITFSYSNISAIAPIDQIEQVRSYIERMSLLTNNEQNNAMKAFITMGEVCLFGLFNDKNNNCFNCVDSGMVVDFAKKHSLEMEWGQIEFSNSF